MDDLLTGNHAIICGFGLPGRAVAERLESKELPYAVIETNAVTCDRAIKSGRVMIEGDATDPASLEAAGIATATLLVVAIPDQTAALQVVERARKLNSQIRIIARTHFLSGGIEAKRLGADIAVVEEQVVGQELIRVLGELDNQTIR